MKKYKAQWYQSPINLPKKTVGKMQVKHRVIPTGAEVIIVGMRQGLLRGIRPTRGIAKAPLRIHELYETKEKHKSLWMTDLPEELNQIGELMHTVQPSDRVLIGGLGLGILAATVAYAGSASIVVVERSRDVIKLCANPSLYRTVCSDIMKYLQTTKEEFDYYLLDTWAGTNEGTWWDTVMPLRRIIRQRWGIGPTIHCWAEDIMWGQLFRSLTNNPPHWHTTYLPVPMSTTTAEAFLNMVGTKWWEKEYGVDVDRYINETSTKRKHA